MEIQVFGTMKCPDTRRALRFFRERRIRLHFVDLRERAASPGELRRFVQRFGVDALVDRSGKRFAEMGLGAAHRSDAWWIDILADEPGLLRTPLARWKERLTIGVDEATWKGWLTETR